MTIGRTAQRGLIAELAFALAAFLIVTLVSHRTQRVVVDLGKVPPGGGEYLRDMVLEMSAGGPARGAAPYVYRAGMPFLVARFFPYRPHEGFLRFNIIAAGLGVMLLVLWLRAFLSNWRVRLILVAVFLLWWHGPTRFIHYYPISTDPALFVFLLAGLLVIERYRERRSAWWLAALALLSFVGVMFKEVAATVGVAALFLDNPVSSWRRRGTPLVETVRWSLIVPLVAAMAGLWAIRHLVVQTNAFSFEDAALQLAFTNRTLMYFYSWFIAFGPLLALLAFDWRRSAAVLADNEFLAIYLAAIAVLGWIGGSESERIVSWSMPAVFVLIGLVIERNALVFATSWATPVLVAAQALNERVFWSVPSPSSAVEALTFQPPWPVVVYSLLNRMLVIDDFHWNLWSYFGSQPFHLVALAWDLVASAGLVIWLGKVSRAVRGPS